MAATFLGSYSVGGAVVGLHAIFTTAGDALADFHATVQAQYDALIAAHASLEIAILASLEAELSATVAMRASFEAQLLLDPTLAFTALITGIAQAQASVAAILQAQLSAAAALTVQIGAQVAIEAELTLKIAGLKLLLNAILVIAAALAALLQIILPILEAILAMKAKLGAAGVRAYLVESPIEDVGADLDALIDGGATGGIGLGTTVRAFVGLVETSDVVAVAGFDAVFRVNP